MLTVGDVPEAITFLTNVLDIELASALQKQVPLYAVLIRVADELYLTLTPKAVSDILR